MNEQIEKLDRQLVKLLKERSQLCAQLEDLDVRALMDIWLEEAVDLELDEVTIEKMFKLAMTLCQKEEE